MTKDKKALWLLAAVVVAAFNLRAPITGVSTLVDTLRSELGLSGSVAGMLTTIPLLVFAVVSPLAGRIADRLGMGRTLLLAVLAILAGCLIRSLAGGAGLLPGMVIIGVGIACGNVLIPVVIKDRWPDRIGPMTSVFTTAMSAFAGLSAAVCVPLSRIPALGWRGALGIWALPAAAAALFWLPLRRWRLSGSASSAPGPAANVWRSRVAWQCTLYMGTQSFCFYSFSAWLPAILAAKGVESSVAGYMASVYQLIGIAANFFAPMTAGRMRDQRLLTGGVGIVYVLGAVLLLLARAPWLLAAAVLLCGFGTGCAFSLCMALIGMRTHTAADASRLSGMLQTVGYAIAAFGPVLVGRVLDASGSWTLPLVCLLAAVALNSAFGQLAGKPGYVE